MANRDRLVLGSADLRDDAITPRLLDLYYGEGGRLLDLANVYGDGESSRAVGRWLEETGKSWRALFPYLSEDRDAMWQALAELKETGEAILFHGHTHQQSVWYWELAGHLRQERASTFQLKAGHRYVVGVGSVGLPEDGGWAAYVLYDANARHVERIRLKGPTLGQWLDRLRAL